MFSPVLIIEGQNTWICYENVYNLCRGKLRRFLLLLLLLLLFLLLLFSDRLKSSKILLYLVFPCADTLSLTMI